MASHLEAVAVFPSFIWKIVNIPVSPRGTDLECCNNEKEERLSRLSRKLKCFPKSLLKAAVIAAVRGLMYLRAQLCS